MGSMHELGELTAAMVLGSSASVSTAERRGGKMEGEASGGSRCGLEAPLDLTGGPVDSVWTPRHAHMVAIA
jgi:hypothetical protein